MAIFFCVKKCIKELSLERKKIYELRNKLRSMRMCISGFSLCYCKGCNLQNDLFMLLIPPICLVDLLLPTWRWAWKYKDFRYYHNSRSSCLKLQEVQTTHRENIVGMNTRKLFVGSDDSFYINLMQRIHLNTNVLNPMMAFWGALLNIDGAILGRKD